MTLHEAIIEILKTQPDHTASIERICSINRSRELYKKRNGEFPETNQISARMTKVDYRHLFRQVAEGVYRLSNGEL